MLFVFRPPDSLLVLLGTRHPAYSDWNVQLHGVGEAEKSVEKKSVNVR